MASKYLRGSVNNVKVVSAIMESQRVILQGGGSLRRKSQIRDYIHVAVNEGLVPELKSEYSKLEHNTADGKFRPSSGSLGTATRSWSSRYRVRGRSRRAAGINPVVHVGPKRDDLAALREYYAYYYQGRRNKSIDKAQGIVHTHFPEWGAKRRINKNGTWWKGAEPQHILERSWRRWDGYIRNRVGELTIKNLQKAAQRAGRQAGGHKG